MNIYQISILFHVQIHSNQTITSNIVSSALSKYLDYLPDRTVNQKPLANPSYWLAIHPKLHPYEQEPPMDWIPDCHSNEEREEDNQDDESQ